FLQREDAEGQAESLKQVDFIGDECFRSPAERLQDIRNLAACNPRRCVCSARRRLRLLGRKDPHAGFHLASTPASPGWTDALMGNMDAAARRPSARRRFTISVTRSKAFRSRVGINLAPCPAESSAATLWARLSAVKRSGWM